jgi:predicted HicB family RNase H-like nuclease
VIGENRFGSTFVLNPINEEKTMKSAKPEVDTKKLIDEQVSVKSAEPKKKKKDKLSDESVTSPAKAIKSKPVKSEKTIAKPKAQKAPKVDKLKAPKADKLKAPKEDKATKFLVSMKKSVRKSIKKEAADVGVSMNEYIVSAVVEKLNKTPFDDTK